MAKHRRVKKGTKKSKTKIHPSHAMHKAEKKMRRKRS
jgi:hypothetical protein